MKKHYIMIAATVAGLTACTVAPEAQMTDGIPDAVRAIAAPGQDLSTARLLPEDNCYWYSYPGLVETTELPLRDTMGRPICAAPRI